jgi:hypothetical protein
VILCHDLLRHSQRLTICPPLISFTSKAQSKFPGSDGFQNHDQQNDEIPAQIHAWDSLPLLGGRLDAVISKMMKFLRKSTRGTLYHFWVVGSMRTPRRQNSFQFPNPAHLAVKLYFENHLHTSPSNFLLAMNPCDVHASPCDVANAQSSTLDCAFGVGLLSFGLELPRLLGSSKLF